VVCDFDGLGERAEMVAAIAAPIDPIRSRALPVRRVGPLTTRAGVTFG
jgi:hypothetical protein